MSVNTRVIDNENNRTLYVGDVVDGILAADQVALGNAEKIPEAEVPVVAVAVPVEETAPAEVDATQAALDHAKAMGIDIATIQGSGMDGRVTKADVEAAIAARG